MGTRRAKGRHQQCTLDATPSTAASATPLRLPDGHRARRPLTAIRCSENTRSLPEGPMHCSLRVTPKARCRSKGFALRSVVFIRWTALSLSWERRDTSTKRKPPRERCGSFVAPTISNPGGALSPSQMGSKVQSPRGGTPQRCQAFGELYTPLRPSSGEGR